MGAIQEKDGNASGGCVNHGRSCIVGKGGGGTTHLTILCVCAIARANDSKDGRGI